MQQTGKMVTVITGSVVVLLLVLFVGLTGMSASLAWSNGGGSSSDPALCQTATPKAGTPLPGGIATSGTISSPPAPGTTPTTGATTPACVAPSKIGAQVVALARKMADALYVNPACGGHISFPTCYDTWYKAPGSAYPPGAPSFPQAVIQYGQQVCPGCSAWQSGSYQCVSFVRGAYSQVYPMRLTANAFDLWATYAGQPGWQEIPSAAAPPGQRGLPMPGDVMIFKDSSIGHAAIVMSVVLPSTRMDGAITFSNSNSVSPYTTMPLLPDLSVDSAAWPGYSVWGYIRPAVSTQPSTTTTTPGPISA